MQRIQFNTGRKYTADGQRIVATRRDDGTVTFHDIDRLITGELRCKATEAEFTKENVLSEYDRLQYDNTSRAWEDGMTRNGGNAYWEEEEVAPEPERKPAWGSQQWAETYSDDLGESPDY